MVPRHRDGSVEQHAHRQARAARARRAVEDADGGDSCANDVERSVEEESAQERRVLRHAADEHLAHVVSARDRDRHEECNERNGERGEQAEHPFQGRDAARHVDLHRMRVRGARAPGEGASFRSRPARADLA